MEAPQYHLFCNRLPIELLILATVGSLLIGIVTIFLPTMDIYILYPIEFGFICVFGMVNGATGIWKKYCLERNQEGPPWYQDLTSEVIFIVAGGLSTVATYYTINVVESDWFCIGNVTAIVASGYFMYLIEKLRNALEIVAVVQERRLGINRQDPGNRDDGLFDPLSFSAEVPEMYEPILGA